MLTFENQKFYAEIANFFIGTIGVEVPSPTTDLFKTGILDSQNFIELLIHLERTFDTPISLFELDIENFRCIDKIANLLNTHKSSANRSHG
jgi:acyl carrier protein